MKNRSRPTQAKRAREKALLEKREKKAARKVEAKARRASGIRMEDMEEENPFLNLPEDGPENGEDAELEPQLDEDESPSNV